MIYKHVGEIKPRSSLTVFLINKWDLKHFNAAKELIEDKASRLDIEFPFFTEDHSFYIYREPSSTDFIIIADHNSFPFEDRLMACTVINEIYARVVMNNPRKSKLKQIGAIINEAYMTVTERIISESNED